VYTYYSHIGVCAQFPVSRTQKNLSRDYNIIIDACLKICPFTQDCGLDQCMYYVYYAKFKTAVWFIWAAKRTDVKRPTCQNTHMVFVTTKAKTQTGFIMRTVLIRINDRVKRFSVFIYYYVFFRTNIHTIYAYRMEDMLRVR